MDQQTGHQIILLQMVTGTLVLYPHEKNSWMSSLRQNPTTTRIGIDMPARIITVQKKSWWLPRMPNMVSTEPGRQARTSQKQITNKRMNWQKFRKCKALCSLYERCNRAEHSPQSPVAFWREMRSLCTPTPWNTCALAQNKVSSVLETRSFLYFAFSVVKTLNHNHS